MDFATANCEKDTTITTEKKVDRQNGENTVKKGKEWNNEESKQKKKREERKHLANFFFKHLGGEQANLDVTNMFGL